MDKKNGFFITFEGPEGAGKSSQVRMLAEYLTALGMECILTREPGGTPLAEDIRQVVKSHHSSEPVHPETELLLMEAARSQHVHEVILPALAAGKTVICDRFYDSTTAYQGGARNLPLDTINILNSFAAAGRKPDLTFLMDLPPEVGFERIRSRESEGYDRFENENIQFHRTVRQAFIDLAAGEPERVKVIDATADIATISEQIRKIVDEHLR
ncbi:MAG: dTMP kinase [Lentisphaeria bacterium]|nr:dTMP kinase [Lentisphaeria bacterium]